MEISDALVQEESGIGISGALVSEGSAMWNSRRPCPGGRGWMTQRYSLLMEWSGVRASTTATFREKVPLSFFRR